MRSISNKQRGAVRLRRLDYCGVPRLFPSARTKAATLTYSFCVRSSQLYVRGHNYAEQCSRLNFKHLLMRGVYRKQCVAFLPPMPC